MARLTAPGGKMIACLRCKAGNLGNCSANPCNALRTVLARLSAYEDTGVAPGAINRMKDICHRAAEQLPLGFHVT